MTILIIILVIIAIPLIIALFVQKEYNIVREVVIDKSVTEVFRLYQTFEKSRLL
jgi:preprotein translocase subunit SecG